MAEPAAGVVLELRGVRKDYRGLRPLRIAQLELREGQRLALTGFDQASAEVFVNLVTGATLPDAGEVRVFGRITAAIEDAQAWLDSLDGFGILTDRAVLLEQLSVEQNMAVPLTLELAPLAADIRQRVAELAAEVGLEPADLGRIVGTVGAAVRARLRLARAIALHPRVLLAEHPNASVPPADLPRFAADLTAVAVRRGLACLTLTADREFAEGVAVDVLSLDPASGSLRPAAAWRRWFGR